MPTLNWIGKQAVIKHHQEVPYRLLKPVSELLLPVLSESPVRAEPVEAHVSISVRAERSRLRGGEVEAYPSTGSGRTDDFGGNLIVQADNLPALKAYLLRYAQGASAPQRCEHKKAK